MKILAINSSHRGDTGYTKFLIDKLFPGAIEAGAKCEVVTLARLKINRCISCDNCHSKEHYLTCIYDDKDDIRAIFQKMSVADIIIFGTPVYIFNMSGLMKIFLDRLTATGDPNEMQLSESGLIFHYTDHSICSKPFVVLACCDNMENETTKNVLSYFKTYSKFMDAPQAGILVRQLGKMVGHGKDTEKEKKYPKIQNVYKAYYQAGKELAIKGKISRSTQHKANQNILPIPSIIIFFMKYKFFKKLMFNVIKAKSTGFKTLNNS
jgi:multimeric flavodoxin WrbA